MTDETTLELHTAPGVCDECFRTNLARNSKTGDVSVYCSHNQCGGKYNLRLERWTLVTPVTGEGFSHWLQERDQIRQGMKNLADQSQQNVTQH